ncbi:MAG: GNAT family N-acetyltransferase [Bdellovibrio sp.]|nr:GNAT family N-acetyltransferase [Bdellovibrio sp.]
MKIEIVYASEKYFQSFYEALSQVAKERIYIEMVEAPPYEKVVGFQQDNISKNAAVYYAVQGDRVVGWCDIFSSNNPRMSHRGGLGMGLLPEFRGLGLGSKLLKSALEHAQKIGLEKVELHVYSSNISAIALYKNFGFEQEGLLKKYRKLDGQDFDCLAMAKFFNKE